MKLGNILVEVYRRYSEPHRKYHTLKHVMDMFGLAQERGIELTEEQVLAIWLHDIVYRVPADPKESNEAASAKLSTVLLGELGFPLSRIGGVCGIIMDTEKELPSVFDSAVVIDLDLAGLALNYWGNRNLVRAEYSCYSDEEFKVGRRKWVESMLKRERIFVSGKFDDLEAEARQELKKDLVFCCQKD